MHFKDWLIEIGKSDRTADSYSRAVSGVISNWANQAGLCEKNLNEVRGADELSTVVNGLENEAI